MGCDIHLSVERKNPNTGKWEWVNPEGIAPQDEFEKEHGYWSWYGGRNYGLFAILANVRNGFGFAGVDTGDGYKPIAMPRGVPEDASGEYLAEVERWGVDGHSHSYFTLQELLDYDWTQTTTRRGFIDPMEFVEMSHRDEPIPHGWCGGTSAEKLTPERMEKFVRTTFFLSRLEQTVERWKQLINDPDREKWREHDIEKLPRLSPLLETQKLAHKPSYDALFREGTSYAMHYQWEQSYADVAQYFLSTTLPALQELGDSDQVRICFYFDN